MISTLQKILNACNSQTNRIFLYIKLHSISRLTKFLYIYGNQNCTILLASRQNRISTFYYRATGKVFFSRTFYNSIYATVFLDWRRKSCDEFKMKIENGQTQGKWTLDAKFLVQDGYQVLRKYLLEDNNFRFLITYILRQTPTTHSYRDEKSKKK